MYQSGGNETSLTVSCHLHTNVGGFYEKYFSSAKTSNTAARLLKKINQHDDLDIAQPSFEHLTRDGFLSWLDRLIPDGRFEWKNISRKDSNITVVSLHKSPASLSKNPMNLFTRVIGVQSDLALKLYPLSFMQLYENARIVFEQEPTRLFLHGFLLRREAIEFWIFDRAGAYCSTPLNVLPNFKLFMDAMKVYIHHNEVELGSNPFLGHIDGCTMILNRQVAGNASKSSLVLQTDPFIDCEGEELVSAGLTAYLAQKPHSTDQRLVVKFKWKEDSEESEGSLLESIMARNVRGVVQLYCYEEITSTDEMRKNLVFGKPQKLEFNNRRNLSESVSEADSHMQPSIPSASSSDHNSSGMQDFLTMTNTSNNGEAYKNRSLSYIAVYPYGVRLHEYKSPKQAIQGLQDALAGHRSLYQQGRLLHRDISIFNILLTMEDISSNSTYDSPRGFLIDLDCARNMELPRTRNSFYGTPPFMGIRVLQSREQTYRQDLESFLYILIWVAVSPRSARLVENTKMSRWREGEDEELARVKLLDMASDGFETLLRDFDPDFQMFRDLARDLRLALFVREGGGGDDPGDSESLWTGTDESLEGTNLLYDKMLAAFDRAIDSAL